MMSNEYPIQYISARCNNQSRVPKSYSSNTQEDGFVLILEDLDVTGFPKRKSHLSLTEVKVCVNWLANFHATFIGEEPVGLWEEGSYWHLATRPDELKEMKAGNLKDKAVEIDNLLKNCNRQKL